MSAHCLIHNDATDALKQLIKQLKEIDLDTVENSDDAAEAVDRISQIGADLEELQPSVDLCKQRSEKVLEELAKQDRETVRKQAQVCNVWTACHTVS